MLRKTLKSTDAHVQIEEELDHGDLAHGRIILLILGYLVHPAVADIDVSGVGLGAVTYICWLLAIKYCHLNMTNAESMELS